MERLPCFIHSGKIRATRIAAVEIEGVMCDHTNKKQIQRIMPERGRDLAGDAELRREQEGTERAGWYEERKRVQRGMLWM